MKRTIILIAFAFLISCQSNLHRLKAVETVLWEKPDSALVLLEQMDSLQGGFSTHEKAYFGLLKSIALDKNYIDITTDSLIRPAVEYYDKWKNHYRSMLSHYYCGVIYENAQSYTSAIIEFDKAEKEAERIGNELYHGHILTHKGYVFSTNYNYEQAILCLDDAITHYDRINESLFKDFGIYSLAVEYANSKEYSQADSVIRLLKRPHPNKDLEEQSLILEGLILSCINADPDKIIEKYTLAGPRYYTLIDYPLLGTAYERNAQPDSADLWFNRAYSSATDKADSAVVNSMKANVEHDRGNNSTAYSLVSKALDAQNSVVHDALKQSLSITQRDYYKEEYRFKEKSLEKLRIIFGLSFAVLVLIILLLVVSFRYYAKKKDEAIKEGMAELAIQQEQLSKARKDNAALTGSIFRDKFLQLHSISADYFKADSAQQKEIVFANFKHVLKEYTDGPVFFETLENDLNRYCDNVMAKLREQVSEIKGQNLKIIALLFAGQSYNTIKLILNAQSIEALKTAKSRYRKAIKESYAPDTNLFLEMLDKK